VVVVASYVEVEGCEGVSGEVGDLGSVELFAVGLDDAEVARFPVAFADLDVVLFPERRVLFAEKLLESG